MAKCDKYAFNKEALTINIPKCLGLEMSPYNHVGIQVERGIEILNLEATAKTMQMYRREFVLCNRNMPLAKWLRRDDNSIMWMSSAIERNEMVLLPDTYFALCKHPPAPAIAHFAFSPPLHNQCFLAVITTHGAGDIYQRIGCNWVPHVDFAQIWLDMCMSKWETAINYRLWKEQLFQGKPKTLCWLKHAENLFLVVCLLSGSMLIFQKTDFGVSLMACIESQVKEPCKIYALTNNDEFIIIALSYNGQITSLSIKDWKLIKEELIWSECDYEECKDIVSVGNQVVFNKTNFIIFHTIEPNGTFSQKEKTFKSSVVKIFLADDFISTLLSDCSLVKLSLPQLVEISRSMLDIDVCSSAVMSRNSAFTVLASNLTLKVYINPNADVVKELTLTILNQPMIDCSDFLWLVKWKLINDNDNRVKPSRLENSPQLRYWMLHLMRTIEMNNKETITTSSIQNQLTQLEIEILQNYVLKNPHLNGCLSAILGLSSDETRCVMCSDLVIRHTAKTVECGRGHLTARCCFTLQAFTTPYYKTCILCSAVCNSVVALSDTCYFCGGIFTNSVSWV